VKRDDEWRYREGESDLDYQLRRMSAHGYTFTDLKLKPGESPRRRVAKTLSLISRTLGDSSGNVLIPSLGRSYAQSLEYVPPDHALTVLVGQSLEVGYSFTRGDAPANWARFHASLGIEGLLTALGPAAGRFISFAPKLGVEFEPVPLSGAALQWRLGLRGGFQLSSADEFTRRACAQSLPCSRPVAEVYGAVTAFQWVRAQLAVEFLPPVFGLPFAAAFKPSLGAEFDWP
jgi:hypothetical protein